MSPCYVADIVLNTNPHNKSIIRNERIEKTEEKEDKEHISIKNYSPERTVN